MDPLALAYRPRSYTSAPRALQDRFTAPPTPPSPGSPDGPFSMSRQASFDSSHRSIPMHPPMPLARSRTMESSSRSMADLKLNRASQSYLIALNDTPATTAPNSPTIGPRRHYSSGEKSMRVRPTTLNIPGLTKSNVSPDGRIAQRDVGAKLVIVMVGLPARGKSYITKKLARYLNWLQHDTRIFNVGARRRVAAGGGGHAQAVEPQSVSAPTTTTTTTSSRSAIPISTPTIIRPNNGTAPADVITNSTTTRNTDHRHIVAVDQSKLAAHILFNNDSAIEMSPEPVTAIHESGEIPELKLSDAAMRKMSDEANATTTAAEGMDQSASFFDPSNARAAQIREQVAMETLDELLHYILEEGGSVGILDATNSTLERRRLIMQRIRERAGPQLNVLFCESLCVDKDLLERNMMLKLSGPDYKDKDPVASLADFKKRVEMYEQKYVPLGEYEEKNNMPYVQMVDVGRKVISHQIKGFLSAQAVYYLLNFNLAPRQIWITRHGESEDNVSGKLGGDAPLTDAGRRYAKALSKFLFQERNVWEVKEISKAHSAHDSLFPGASTPPNPHYANDLENHIVEKNFCVWTSMLKRSVETAQYFDDEFFDVKQMRMLNELNSGNYEGMTYEEIKTWHREEFNARRQDKLQYRYPGPGGEGYLDVVNRLRPVIVELERMTDHCLLIGHRSVARILLAYFKGLDRSMVPDLDVPLGMLWCLEPKPYGVSLKAYQYDAQKETFNHVPDYELRCVPSHGEHKES